MDQVKQSGNNYPPIKSLKVKRKEASLELAQLLYDIYKESAASDKLDNGQNNAQSSTES